MPDAAVIALFGPTGVGKTELAVALARRLRAAGRDPVAVSADALQVYLGLEALTGVATREQQAELEHRLIGILEVQESFSAGRYMRLAHAEIDALLAAGRTPIVVGGTGLYLRAALADLDFPPPPPPQLRARWVAELERRGVRELHGELALRAPASAARIDPNDRSRVIRALELADLGRQGTAGTQADSQLWTAQTRHPTLLIGLTMERETLYRRIDARVDAIVAAGAAAEVRAADCAGASPTARRALGFSELLQGDIEAMRQRTRRYAKRQLTWMRKLGGVQVLDVTGRAPDELARSLVIIGALGGASARPHNDDLHGPGSEARR